MAFSCFAKTQLLILPGLQPGVIGHVAQIENRFNGLPEPGPFARQLDRFGKPLKRFGNFERAH
jgi:hypothetical protein